MKALVTGGNGFLGGAIVGLLLAQGHGVRSFSRKACPGLESMGVEVLQGDLADAEVVSRAVAGCDTVFHVAAKAGVWGPSSEYWRTNVTGTENVIAACHAQGVARLVYTSSPSVVFDGGDGEGLSESAPYPGHFLCAYPETKARAEQAVLAVNGNGLATVALRPHLIWGPGDAHLVPRIIARAKTGRLWHIGDGSNRVDSTYIDNAALAHLLAAERLGKGAACAGKAYFISNGEPMPIRELIAGILDAAGLPPVSRALPVPVAYLMAAALEGGFTLLGREEEPPLTRFVVRQLSRAHWFDLSAAGRDLGYAPQVSIREGLARLKLTLAARTGNDSLAN